MPAEHRAFPHLTHDADYRRVQDLLEAIGLSPLYGGGPSSKGHGFWISYGGKTLYNDGLESGNPAFWMACDAHQLVMEADTYALCGDYEGKLNEFLSALTVRPDPRLIGETESNRQDAKTGRYGWSCLAHSTLMLGHGRVVDAVRWGIDVWCDPIGSDWSGAVY